MRYTSVFLVVAALALAGCNSQDASNLKNDTQQLAQHAGQAVSGVTLAAKVNSVLAMRKGVDMSGMHVEAKDGVVTLSGHARDEEERARVIETVNGIRGVDRVISTDLHVGVDTAEPRKGLGPQ